ncbi:hypothetical+protein [Methylocapsa aurea]|uniref:hypothetical protein n=1 Tax=Methylocapsa aurea TaxID=663610 RepID=UPI003D188922
MAEPTQFTFDLKEVTEALVRKQGLKEGKWTISFEMTLIAGAFGSNPKDVRPGAMMQISSVKLIRGGPDDHPLPWTVDAKDLENQP